MDYKGKTHLLFVIIAPPDQVEEGDRIFRSHGPWMERTHPRDGENALLTYNVSKAPELANPLDPNPTPTGNTCFILDEIYESDAGVANHFELAMGGWQDFPAILQWMEKCKVTIIPKATVFNSLW